MASSPSRHNDVVSDTSTTVFVKGNSHNPLPMVVVLAGPTGVGKSDVAARLCAAITTLTIRVTTHSDSSPQSNLNDALDTQNDTITSMYQSAMIVSADSVQAYQGVQIGANKPTEQERHATPHLLVDLVSTDSDYEYNAAEWQRDALHVISKLLAQAAPAMDTAAGSNDGDGDCLSSTDEDGNDKDDSSTTQAQRQIRQQRRLEIDKSIADAKQQQQQQQHQQQEVHAQQQQAPPPPSTSKPILPVVVGGTMMYLQWLVHGRPDSLKPTPKAAEEAHRIIHSFQEQYDQDNTNNIHENPDDTDDTAWEQALQYVANEGDVFAKRLTTLHGKDWYRLRRTLEIALTVKEQQQQQENGDATTNNNNNQKLNEQLYTGQRHGSLESYGYDVRCFFLCPDDRMKHTELVDERCEVMIQRGLIEETTRLELGKQLPAMAKRAIGYRQTLDYLLREAPKENDQDAFVEYLNQFTTATRRYSKKQMSWFRKDDSFVFVPVVISNTVDKATRVRDAANAIQECISLPREEFEAKCFSKDSVSAKTRHENEAQAKGMKFYHFQRYRLKPGTPAFQKALEEADQCTHQLQAKKQKTGDANGDA